MGNTLETGFNENDIALVSKWIAGIPVGLNNMAVGSIIDGMHLRMFPALLEKISYSVKALLIDPANSNTQPIDLDEIMTRVGKLESKASIPLRNRLSEIFNEIPWFEDMDAASAILAGESNDK